jgi:hypothetical protein
MTITGRSTCDRRGRAFGDGLARLGDGEGCADGIGVDVGGAVLDRVVGAGTAVGANDAADPGLVDASDVPPDEDVPQPVSTTRPSASAAHRPARLRHVTGLP